MSDKRNRVLGQRARPARNMVVEMLTELRTVLADDALYESALYQVEGWIQGQRAWLNGVKRVDSGVGSNGDSAPAGGTATDEPRSSADTEQPKLHALPVIDRPAVGNG